MPPMMPPPPPALAEDRKAVVARAPMGAPAGGPMDGYGSGPPAMSGGGPAMPMGGPMGGHGGGAPAMPAGRSPAMSQTVRRAEKQEVAEEDAGGDALGAAAPSMASSAYLAALATLARELEAQGRGRADAAAIRLLRQRLTEWVEDVRSVGGHDALASAIEQLVQRLSAALAAGQDGAGEAIAVAAELARYAAGGAPPLAPKQGRAFWK